MTTPTEALAAATHEECEAFWAGLPPDVSISMHRADAHLEASERRLSALSSSGWSLVRTEGHRCETVLENAVGKASIRCFSVGGHTGEHVW